MIDIKLLTASDAQSYLPQLSEVLFACVEQGASIGFVAGFDRQQAQVFWQNVIQGVTAGERKLLAAWWDGELVGTVQLVVAAPANGQHRAEVVKLLVAPQARQRGIARQLMLEVEVLAQQAQRSLLVLDTRSGDVASLLYLSLGYQICGEIPHYARSIDGELHATTVMYKSLSQ